MSAILGPLAALIAYRMVMGGSPVTFIDATDETMLRRVFFSGEVWAVACENSDNFEAVASRLASEFHFGVLDCEAKLPSGRSTMKRFKLENTKPVVFVANGVQTTQLPAVRSEYDLVREIRLAATRRPVEVKNDETFRDRCLSKPLCLLVLRGGSELEPAAHKALDALMGEHTNVNFAAVDSAEWRFDFEGYDEGDAVRLRNFEKGTHRAILFQNDTDIFAIAHNKGFGTLGAFLEKPKFVKLQTPPTLLKRPKKRPPPPKPKPEPIPETIDPKKLKEQRRQAEKNRRDQMEKEAEQFTAEAVDDDDFVEDDDDVEDVQDLDDDVEDLD